MSNKHPIRVLVFFIALLSLLLFTSHCYYSVLNSPFILDDEPNFYGLRFVHDIPSALAYSFSGPAGTRWISFLTFTAPIELDAWSNSNAYPFKLINLIIHGFNGVLVFGCLKQLLSLKHQPLPQPLLWAAGIAVIWAIHPIHVNTVLYSVQRMTLLGSTAVLAGVYYHLAFLKNNLQPIARTSWVAYTTIVWLITAIGILCKESAILLPLYILVCYTFIPQRPFTRLQTGLSLITPYLLLITYLILKQRFGFGGRNFTMEERLLSEVVILKEYVIKIMLPSFSSFSLYYDDFKYVKTITDMRFIMSSLFWLAFITSAKLGNKYIPGLWFGCLWFLAGHALESTIIPLELYFDHRNYLPSLGILIMMALSLQYSFISINKKSIRVLLSILIIAITAKYLFLLKKETGYWHNDATLSTSLIEKHPDSIRTTQYFIENLVSQNRYPEAIQMLNYVHQKFGIYASNAIFQVGFSCLSQPDAPINHQALLEDLKILPADSAVSDAMDFIMQLTKNKACPSFSWEMYGKYTQALLANPNQRRHYHNLVFLLMSSYMIREDLTSALQSSYQLPKDLHTPQFLFLQMHLSLATKNSAAAESVYAEIDGLDKPEKMLYHEDIENIRLALKRLHDENKN